MTASRRLALVALTLVTAVGTASAGITASGQPADGDPVHSDFDGDGHEDLAIGVPSETVNGHVQAGAVHILYGGSNGLTATGDQYFTQSSAGISGAPQRRDFFGQSLAAGDFDGDGYADLAIGIPGEDIGSTPDAGIVEILHGSRTGLAPRSKLSFATTGGERCTCRFGEALTAGDFDDSGVADLAIGAPARPYSPWDPRYLAHLEEPTGAVVALYGARDTGLRGSRRTVVEPPLGGSNTLVSVLVDFFVQNWSLREFGAALAAGDHDGDGDDDLAIGIPASDLRYLAGVTGGLGVDTKDETGGVLLYRGSSGGINRDERAPLVWQLDFADDIAEGDRFGSTLAFGDLDGNGKEELLVGAPRQDLPGKKTDAGAVYVVTSIRTFSGKRLTQGVLPDAAPEAADLFGHALATGDFDSDGRADLAIGAPYENFAGKTNAGVVHVLWGGSTGARTTDALIFHQNTPGIAGAAEAGDAFGLALATGRYGGRDDDALAIGIPGEALGATKAAGAVAVLYGNANRLPSTNSQFWSQNSDGIADAASASDKFGTSLG